MKFVLTDNGFVEAETLNATMQAAIPTWTDKINPLYHLDQWWEGAKEDIAQGWDNFWENVADGYYEFISWAFSELTRLVTTVPTDLIANDNAFKMQAIFMGYSVLMMVFLAIAEGYKALFGISYTKPSIIFGRTFVALIGAGLTIPAVVWLIESCNLAVQMVLAIGEHYFSGSQDLGGMLRDFSASGVGNFFASILFMIVFFYFICHALFKVGIRWFKLLMNMVASPFAWGAYVTNGTATHLSNWMSSTGKLILINLVYAFYVTVISVVVLAPGEVSSFGGWLARMLLIVGGLHSLAHPPQWIQSMDAQGTLMPVFKRVFKMVTFKKLRTGR